MLLHKKPGSGVGGHAQPGEGGVAGADGTGGELHREQDLEEGQ